jgi:hypothetical protein
MFKFLGKEACTVQFYGKLPLAKDYLRLGAGEGSGQALRDWLDRAFSQGANAKDPLVLPWPAAVIVGESWGQPLCAAAWPSSDAGNLRPFPFTAFVERKKKALLEDLERGLPVGSPILDWLAEAYAARDSHGDGKSFIAAMRERELAIDALVPFEAERVDFDGWLAALWPDTGKDGLLECLRGLEALRRSSYRGPLRLPLVTNLPSRPQVAAWHRLLVEMNLLARDALPTLWFPLPAAGPPQPAPKTAPEGGEDESAASESSDSDSSFESSDSEASSESEPEVGFDATASESAPEESPESSGAEALVSADDESASPAPVEPAFLVVFRTTPPPTDALWLKPPDARGARRQGDFCAPQGAVAAANDPAPEGAPPLADSLRGAFAGLRGRLAR